MLGYLRHAKAYYGTSAASDYHRIKTSLKVLAELYTDRDVASFGPQQFKAVRQRMVDERKWARSYVNKSMRLVLRMLKWGASEGMYPASVYDTLRLIPALKKGRTDARETEPVKPVCEELVAKTLAFCSPVVADMIRVQLLAGCRPGEVCKLTPAMIDRKGTIWEAKLLDHKTAYRGKDRTIYFGPEAQRVLAPYLLRGEDERLFTPRDSERSRRALLTRSTPANCGNRQGYTRRIREGRPARRLAGDEYNAQSYGKAIRYACKKGKLDPWSPNQLRHTAATKLAERFGIETAGAILGHSKLETTQIYAEKSRKNAHVASLAMG
jgi:integrase